VAAAGVDIRVGLVKKFFLRVRHVPSLNRILMIKILAPELATAGARLIVVLSGKRGAVRPTT
jgi:hypothetical protein